MMSNRSWSAASERLSGFALTEVSIASAGSNAASRVSLTCQRLGLASVCSTCASSAVPGCQAVVGS